MTAYNTVNPNQLITYIRCLAEKWKFKITQKYGNDIKTTAIWNMKEKL